MPMRISHRNKVLEHLWAVWLYKAGPGGLIVHLEIALAGHDAWVRTLAS